MGECDWAILCDYTFLDIGRKMCLIGVFDKVFAAKVPTSLHQSALALKLLGNPSETIQFRIVVAGPGNSQIASVGGGATLPDDSSSINVQLNFAGLSLPALGEYSVSVYVDEVLSKVILFHVVEPPQTQQAGRT